MGRYQDQNLCTGLHRQYENQDWRNHLIHLCYPARGGGGWGGVTNMHDNLAQSLR
jgi:hypothetical protein